MNTPQKKIVNVSCCLIICFNKILILKRDHPGPRNGLWEFPGGKKENETSIECAKREVFEEIEYKISDIKFHSEVTNEYDDIIIILKAYKCNIKSIFKPKLKVHSEYKWEYIRELNKDIFPKANQEIIDILINNE